jgi:tetratricopeptide (TPR) repeat protein
MIEDWKIFKSTVEQYLKNNQFSHVSKLLSNELNKLNLDLEIEKHWEEVVQLFSVQSSANFGTQVEELSIVLASDAFNAEANYNLGCALLEEKKAAFAVGFLSMALTLNQEEPRYLTELISSLEIQGRNEEALSHLIKYDELVLKDDFLVYLKAFNSVFCDEIEMAKQLLGKLDYLKKEPFPFLVKRLEAMIARAEYLYDHPKKITKNYRSKYYITTGGILLNEEIQKECWDSLEQNKLNLIKLAQVLECLELETKTILFPPEFGSTILGQSLSLMLSSNGKKWTGENERGLIVLYDPRDLIVNITKNLEVHQKGQYLFVMAKNHKSETNFSPDILGYLYHENTSPWGPGFTESYDVIDRTGEPIENLVSEVVDFEVINKKEDDESFNDFLEAIKDAPKAARASVFIENGEREKFWVLT